MYEQKTFEGSLLNTAIISFCSRRIHTRHGGIKMTEKTEYECAVVSSEGMLRRIS
jgi:hypothetical protein